MPPKRNITRTAGMEEVNVREENARLRQQIEVLTQRLAELTPQTHEGSGAGGSSSRTTSETHEDVGEDEEEAENPFVHQPDRRRAGRDENKRWESGIPVDLPLFQGGLQPEEFLDWLNAIEETLDYKEVPDNKRVQLVATRFRGRASSWWQQLKTQRTRLGKSKITSWEKLKKHMRSQFLPFNYERTMYMKFQNLRQGNRTVDDYTTEFHEMLTRNTIHETDEQLLSRYIGGMRVEFQNILNLFDLVNISDAYQRALNLEKQFARKTGNIWGGGSVSRAGGSISSGGNNRAISSNNPSKTVTVEPGGKPGSGGLRCFKCGEAGHRAIECRNNAKKSLLIEGDELEEPNLDVHENPSFDIDELDEEIVEGDEGPLLVVRRACLAPRGIEEDWLRSNIFHSTCTIAGKVCRFVIDSDSCENVISEEAVQKLGLKAEKHPNPYKLAWLKKGNEMSVSKRVFVTFSIGSHYKDEVWCDVIIMDACHLLLGRPWQYDRHVVHDGRLNTYSFVFNRRKIVLR